MSQEEQKEKYSTFISDVSEILGLGKPIDILKLCMVTDRFFKPLQNQVKELEAQIEKMKWHKVSDGDLPKDRHNVYVVYLNGNYQLEKTIASFRHKYWVINGLKTECEIIAWCELPKWEIKEK